MSSELLPCCCGCGQCICPPAVTKIRWTGSFYVKPDPCTCRNTVLGSRAGSRFDAYTIQDGSIRTLVAGNCCVYASNFCYQAGATGFGGSSQQVARYSASCVDLGCSSFSCALTYGAEYSIRKPSTTSVRWIARVSMCGLGRIRLDTSGASPQYVEDKVQLLFEAPYLNSCGPSIANFTYLGASYFDGTPVAVGDCVEGWLSSSATTLSSPGLGVIAAINPGSVTLS